MNGLGPSCQTWNSLANWSLRDLCWIFFFYIILNIVVIIESLDKPDLCVKKGSGFDRRSVAKYQEKKTRTMAFIVVRYGGKFALIWCSGWLTLKSTTYFSNLHLVYWSIVWPFCQIIYHRQSSTPPPPLSLKSIFPIQQKSNIKIKNQPTKNISSIQTVSPPFCSHTSKRLVVMNT